MLVVLCKGTIRHNIKGQGKDILKGTVIYCEMQKRVQYKIGKYSLRLILILMQVALWETGHRVTGTQYSSAPTS
jgi:hypothetical protein